MSLETDVSYELAEEAEYYGLIHFARILRSEKLDINEYLGQDIVKMRQEELLLREPLSIPKFHQQRPEEWQGMVPIVPGLSLKGDLRAIFERAAPTDHGWSVEDIVGQMTFDAGRSAVKAAILGMCNDGALHSTIDDDHYASTAADTTVNIANIANIANISNSAGETKSSAPSLFTLTSNGIAQIHNKSTNPMTLQIIAIKELPAQGGQPSRHQITLSDGVHACNGVLATQLNNVVNSGQIKQFTVISITDAMLNDVGKRKLVVVLSATVVGQSETIIGDPHKNYWFQSSEDVNPCVNPHAGLISIFEDDGVLASMNQPHHPDPMAFSQLMQSYGQLDSDSEKLPATVPDITAFRTAFSLHSFGFEFLSRLEADGILAEKKILIAGGSVLRALTANMTTFGETKTRRGTLLGQRGDIDIFVCAQTSKEATILSTRIFHAITEGRNDFRVVRASGVINIIFEPEDQDESFEM